MLLRDCDFHIFKVSYSYDRVVRTPTFGGMDSEYSHTEHNVQSSCLVIAPSLIIAKALFETQYLTTRTIIKIEIVGQVDLMMRG